MEAALRLSERYISPPRETRNRFGRFAGQPSPSSFLIGAGLEIGDRHFVTSLCCEPCLGDLLAAAIFCDHAFPEISSIGQGFSMEQTKKLCNVVAPGGRLVSGYGGEKVRVRQLKLLQHSLAFKATIRVCPASHFAQSPACCIAAWYFASNSPSRATCW